jgi:hypothetical protein
MDVDALGARGREVLADVVGPEGQLAMAAVGEHRELDARRAAVVEEGLDRGADRAPREEDVVDDHDRRPVDREVEVGRVDRRRLGAATEIVAVERDVELAERDLGLEQVPQQPAQAPGEHRAAAVDPDDRHAIVVGVLLDDLVSDPHERAADVVAVEDDLVGCHRLLPGLAGPD